MTQHDALTLLKTGRNAFITGPAGSGKTHVVNEYVKYLKEHGVIVGITASTGIAATHLGGVTIHSWSGMGINNELDSEALAALADKAHVAKRIREAAVLVIDEVSMLHHFRLDTVNAIAQHIRKSSLPFGGLQVVLCGDFFQLPPVSKYGEGDTHFIYRSEAWRDGKFSVCYLSENHRQKDDGLLDILNEIRSGDVSEGAREQLQSRFLARIAASGEDSATTSASPEAMPAIEPTRLYTHNINVDAVNEAELAKVGSPEFLYEMTARGRKPLVEALKRSCLAPERLRLRKGARVMCVKNNFDKGYVNGTLGVVMSCGPGVDPIIRTVPTLEYPRGRELLIELASWMIEDDGKILAEIDQYPLRLAWAITVHKSQGMSLDAVEVDLSRCFEPGMGYVALSRVRTMAGLTILGMNEGALQVHPEVLEYDRHLRELSDKAESVIQHTDEKELVRAQEEFLAKVAPMHGIGSKKKGGRSKEKKVSTYEKTAELVRKRKSLKEIANAREITVETIIAHLEELVSAKNESAVGGDVEGADRDHLDKNVPSNDYNVGLSLKDIAYFKYEVSQRHWGAIEKALAEVADARKDGDAKPPMLSPVKNKLPPNVSFKEIRLARVVLGYVRRE